MTLRTYRSPDQFKQALEQRLLTLAASGAALARQRQLLVFDRFMVRVVGELGDAAILKGGLASNDEVLTPTQRCAGAIAHDPRAPKPRQKPRKIPRPTGAW